MVHLRTLLVATIACIKCHAFAPSSHHHSAQIHVCNKAVRKGNHHPRHLFRELITEDEEDLRADIAVIKKQDGLDDFLKVDDRLCVVK